MKSESQMVTLAQMMVMLLSVLTNNFTQCACAWQYTKQFFVLDLQATSDQRSLLGLPEVWHTSSIFSRSQDIIHAVDILLLILAKRLRLSKIVFASWNGLG
jgi:hypothetical protein